MPSLLFGRALGSWAGKSFVGSRLGIDSLPDSVREFECMKSGLVDFLTECSFEIDPSDYQGLTDGMTGAKDSYSYQPMRAYSLGRGKERIGPDFEVAVKLSSQLEFDGEVFGDIFLIADEQRRHILVSISTD